MSTELIIEYRNNTEYGNNSAMDKPRPCGCKGRRTCLICELEYGINKTDFTLSENVKTYVYCPMCNKAWPGWETDLYKQHPNHEGVSINFPGVYIQLDFLSMKEEEILMKGIDEMKWDPSQSGRRKQNFGPKCNFKKQRLKVGNFAGFPLFSKFVQDKFGSVPIMEGFRTVEQCSLEYDPSRGASIDPHIDDCWVWGERVVTVNLLSDSVLTMTHYKGDEEKYNLKLAAKYPRILNEDGQIVYVHCLEKSNQSDDGGCEVYKKETNLNWPIVRIPMPRRSLLVIYGSARYDWEHCVFRDDIKERRVCLAYREFTPPYLNGAHIQIGNDVLKCAENFWSHLG